MAAVVPVVPTSEVERPGLQSVVSLTFGSEAEGGATSAIASSTGSLPHSIDDVERRGYAVFGSIFVYKNDGVIDYATEKLFCLQRYSFFSGAFRKVSAIMALGSFAIAVFAVSEQKWLRCGLLASIVSPIFVSFSFLTYRKNFGSSADPLSEKLIVVLLIVQSAAIDFSEWARPRLDYGFMVMHFSFIHNFTPLGADSMILVSIFELSLFLVLKILRFLDLDTALDNDEEDETSLSTSKFCVKTGHLADVIIGMVVPSLLLTAQTYVTIKRSNTMRLDMLNQEQIKAQQKLMNQERKTSEDMLRSMLPRKVIETLKINEFVEPQLFENVTVIFAEICRFGDLCQDLEPALVVEVLNVIYLEFDRLSDLLRVYKVETVGQVYMAVVGCPEHIKNHADVASHFALACLVALHKLEDKISRIRQESTMTSGDDRPIQARIGLNSGRLRAGVVGLESPRYKLVGDTVNTASRMESTCEPDRVQVSPSTLSQLSRNMFKIEHRGEIQVKGKPPMRTAYLNGYVDPSMNSRREILIEGIEPQPPKRRSLCGIGSTSTAAFQQVYGHEGMNDGAPNPSPSGFSENTPNPSGSDVYRTTSGISDSSMNMGPVGTHGLTTALPALSAAFKRDIFSGDPAFEDSKSLESKIATKLPDRQSISDIHLFSHAKRCCSLGSTNTWFLLAPVAYTSPEFLQQLKSDREPFEEDTVWSRRAITRGLTLIWLLLITLLTAGDYYLHYLRSDLEQYFWDIHVIARVMGNQVVCIVYLMFLTRTDLFRRYAQRVSIAMLGAQGLSLLVSAFLVYNNESAVIAVYGVYVFLYPVCSILQRLCVCLAGVIGFLLVEFLRCGFASVYEQFRNLAFLITFFCCLSCGIHLEEFMTHVAHYENRRLTARSEDIRIMRESGNELLVNLLPPHVVSLVRNGVSPIAEAYPNVTIIFTDIKGFTAYSAALTPAELMVLLNSMYSAFDEVILNWGLYKVEILGDAYFISSGCPVEEVPWSPDQAAMRAVEVALALLRTMPQVCSDARVQMRVGLHSGPVVAGVVGKKGPRYHLFGPTVVYAEKMESHGEPGRVHISNATYETLQGGDHEYESEKRSISVEGYEDVQTTWFVNKSICKEASKLQRSLIVERHKRNNQKQKGNGFMSPVRTLK
jgi:class 3 adenylate cyclase